MKDHLKVKRNERRVLRSFVLVLLCLLLAAAASACMCANLNITTGNTEKEAIEYASTEEADFETLAEEEEEELIKQISEERKEAIDELTDPEGETPAKTKKKTSSDGSGRSSGGSGGKSNGSGDGNGDGEGNDSESGTEIKKEEKVDVIYSSKVYNLMLIGVDRRDSSWNGNSDTMILVSINYEKQKVTLTSFMRDTWVNIPGVGMRKLNAAFAIGGGPLLTRTIELNFAISVDNYAWIDFDRMKTVIDTLGGVDVTLTAAEARHIGITITGESAVVHLDGTKALAYARDRTTSGWDYGRTQRQRNILMAIINKAKAGGFSDMVGLVQTVLPYFTHNISDARMASLLLDIPTVIGFPFQELRVPFDGLYRSENYNLIPDYGATIRRLYDAIY